jgi:hypothetical protein
MYSHAVQGCTSIRGFVHGNRYEADVYCSFTISVGAFESGRPWPSGRLGVCRLVKACKMLCPPTPNPSVPGRSERIH